MIILGSSHIVIKNISCFIHLNVLFRCPLLTNRKILKHVDGLEFNLSKGSDHVWNIPNSQFVPNLRKSITR